MHLHAQMSGWLRYSVRLNSSCSPKTKRTQDETLKDTLMVSQPLVSRVSPFRRVKKLHQAVPITTMSLTTFSCLGLILLTREDSKVFRVFSVIFFWYSISSLKKKFTKTLRGFYKSPIFGAHDVRPFFSTFQRLCDQSKNFAGFIHERIIL